VRTHIFYLGELPTRRESGLLKLLVRLGETEVTVYVHLNDRGANILQPVS